MKRIITINSNQVPKSIETRNLLKEKLIAAGFDVYYDFHPGTELIISIGGDGSFLKTVHDFTFPKIPIVGINTGHLGFFPEICPDNIDSFIETYLENNFTIEEVSLLKESNSKLQQIEDVNSLEKCYLQQIDQLKADLQDYQEWFDEFKSMFKYDGNEPDCNEELYYCVEETVKENNKLKQTLIEIKEIAEKLTDDYGHKVSNAKIILQKISEVMQ